VVAFPIAWFSPLLTTGLIAPWYMPAWLCENTLFEPDTLTVILSIQKLLETNILLAMVVTFFALVAPLLKCLGMTLINFNLLTDAAQPLIMTLGKLAMADVFLLALHIVIGKGIGVGQIEVGLGLYLVLTSLGISLLTKGTS
jgi:paraquat-inducible protein A